LMRRPGKKGGVDATRVGDEQATVAGEDLAQAFSFLIECGGGVHDIYYPRKKCAVSRLGSLGWTDECVRPYVIRG
jgi:hypothetical protein